MDRLLVFLTPAAQADAGPIAAGLRAIADASQLGFVVVDSAESVARALGSGTGQGSIVVMSPAIEKPLSMSRRIARAHPQSRLVLVAEPAVEAALRREATFGAPRGGRWAIVTLASDALASTVQSLIQAGAQELRLRTTLDAMSRRAAPRPSIDAVEIRRLVVSDRYLASVLQHAHDAIVSLDRGGHVISWNAGAELLFGLSATDVRGREFATAFDDPATFRDALSDRRGDARSRGEFSLASPRQGTRVDAVFDRIADDAGAVGFAVFLRDVTAQHQARQTLLDSSRQKDEFLAMLGHELRNPLAPIRTAAHVISLLTPDNPRARTAAEIIERQVAHMTRLVDDLLDVARVTRGVVTLVREPVRLSAIAYEAVEQVQPALTAREQQLVIEIPDDRLSVSGDRKRLVQVVANLLGNAAKFTDRGGRITLSVSSTDDEASMAVADNGIGIDPVLLPRVFDLFAQGERPADRPLGGLGLGLALVKNIVQLHGGRAEVFSAGPGQGSQFTLHLPRLVEPGAALPPDEPLRPAVPAAPLRVMLVDDNADIVQTLSMLLETLGHEVLAETDPRAAIARAPAAQPDVYVVDIGMPDVDGYEVARTLRADKRLGRPTLIALTGYTQPADVARALDAGFDHHLSKPLEVERLESILRAIAPTPPLTHH